MEIRGNPLFYCTHLINWSFKDFEGVHTCHINDTLYSMLATLRKTRVHRFMVVDKENKLIGVVTLSDILNFLLNINDMDKA